MLSLSLVSSFATQLGRRNDIRGAKEIGGTLSDISGTLVVASIVNALTAFSSKGLAALMIRLL
jgi:hypothetical protein